MLNISPPSGGWGSGWWARGFQNPIYFGETLVLYSLFLYWIVAHFTMRTHGLNQAFRCVEGIWLHRKSRQIRKYFRKRLILHHTSEHVLSYHLI